MSWGRGRGAAAEEWAGRTDSESGSSGTPVAVVEKPAVPAALLSDVANTVGSASACEHEVSLNMQFQYPYLC